MTTPFSTRPDSLETKAPYKFFTYLLTYVRRGYEYFAIFRMFFVVLCNVFQRLLDVPGAPKVETFNMVTACREIFGRLVSSKSQMPINH